MQRIMLRPPLLGGPTPSQNLKKSHQQRSKFMGPYNCEACPQKRHMLTSSCGQEVISVVDEHDEHHYHVPVVPNTGWSVAARLWEWRAPVRGARHSRPETGNCLFTHSYICASTRLSLAQVHKSTYDYIDANWTQLLLPGKRQTMFDKCKPSNVTGLGPHNHG
jgi:hypothetical protein